MPKKLLILASGYGSNLESLCRAIENKQVPHARICHLIVDRINTRAEIFAKSHSIPVTLVEYKEFSIKSEFHDALFSNIKKIDASEKVDFILALGFMRLLAKKLVRHYRGRLINIHPSLLPAFPGANAIVDALNYGVRVTGSTIHFIDEGMDTGPIICQEAVTIQVDETCDSLKEKVQKIEHKNLIRMTQLLCDNKIYLTEENKVKFL